MSAIIALDGVTKVFAGGIVAVDDVTLAVREGEFVTLLGPSGCGKTTTLRMIAGFESPDRGRVFLAGLDVTEQPPYRRPVNTVFQDYALFPHMNVAANVGYGLSVAGVARREIERKVVDALTMVGLLDKAAERPQALSGGQRQRVALARALVREPKVLLLDEPLSALDAKLRESMQVELKHLHERLGITFLLVTHDQTEALVMSDRVVVMDRGRIAQEGSPSELYDRPASPYVANFIGTSNLIEGRIGEAGPDGSLVLLKAAALRSAAPANGLKVGDAAVACVRPEKALLLLDGDPPPAGFNALPVRVKEHLFHGDSVRVEVELAGQVFAVDVQLTAAHGRARLPRPGEAAVVAIDPENVIVFHPERPRTEP
jgi:spermidine/putrescine ABC transporter ATP-binding subunit